MILVTPKSILDYQTCARLYDYRYNDRLYEATQKRDLLANRFENTLKRVLSFYFYKRQGGITPSYSALLSRWERLWFPKNMTAYDIAVEQHESAYGNLASFSNDAATALIQFYEDFTEDLTWDPILIDEPFTVPLDDGIRMEGSFDLCLCNPKKKAFKVIKWSVRHRRPAFSTLLIDFATLKYAFDYRYENKVKAEFYLYDLMSAKTGFSPINIEPEDIKALQFWANEISTDKVFPSRRDLTYYCKSCPYYDSPCATWKAWE